MSLFGWLRPVANLFLCLLPIYCVTERFFMLKVWWFVENKLPLQAYKYNKKRVIKRR